ncbi:hypothetical protein BGX26_002998 [Mortierella sp. AD094]|nr:hypothetical protein BGX26_002998 [Mortierella sp. AD094]
MKWTINPLENRSTVDHSLIKLGRMASDLLTEDQRLAMTSPSHPASPIIQHDIAFEDSHQSTQSFNGTIPVSNTFEPCDVQETRKRKTRLEEEENRCISTSPVAIHSLIILNDTNIEPSSKSYNGDHTSSQTSVKLESTQPRHPQQYDQNELFHSAALHSTSRYESDAKRKKINNKSGAVFSDDKDSAAEEETVFLHGPEHIVTMDSEDLIRSISKDTKPTISKVSLSRTKMYECLHPDCGKAYTKPSRLAEHERTHTNERPFKCYQEGCHASFTREDHFATHLKSHDSTREFRCNQQGCTKAYYTKDKLNRHLKSHDGIANILELSLTTSQPSSQPRSDISSDPSTLSHNEDDKGQEYITTIDLRKVAEEIIKEKPYACSWDGCIKRFTKHQKLKAHICMVHEGRKPYPCTHEDCSMSFQTPSKLRKHQLVHSGMSACLIIEFHMFKIQNLYLITERTLATHIKTVHEKKVETPKFKCEYEGCGIGFDFKHVLEKHVQRKHLNPQPKKKRSDAIESTVLDDLLGFTDDDAVKKLPYACSFPSCEMRYSKERLLRKHLKSSAHRTGEITGTEFLHSMDEVENQTIRHMIELNLETHGKDGKM